MTLCFWPSSKWQETASRIIVFDSSSIGFRENRKAERALDSRLQGILARRR